MAAAVADFTPARVLDNKLKKDTGEGLTLQLDKSPDILRTIAGAGDSRLIVGFAAETQDLVDNAGKKLREKSLDLIVANDVSGEETGFDSVENSGIILGLDGYSEEIPRMSKTVMADRILDTALKTWKRKINGT
jgi:phosphopantothenoylcysteine decarboxylase/phosphopantothenate--cysteine ligase